MTRLLLVVAVLHGLFAANISQGQSTSAGLSCAGRCSAWSRTGYNERAQCQCDRACSQHQNCCTDYLAQCRGTTTRGRTRDVVQPLTSCMSRCSLGYKKDLPCQCNTACQRYKNCCQDYSIRCLGTTGSVTTTTKLVTTNVRPSPPWPTGPKKVISDVELSDIVTRMWNSDGNYAIVGTQYNLKIQGKNSGSSKVDRAIMSRLFTFVSQSVLDRPTYASFVNLLNNYIVDTGRSESVSSVELAENQRFLDSVLETNVMDQAWRFLSSKGYSSNSKAAFKRQLMDIWFTLYSREAGKLDTSGFEHVFVGEFKNGLVSGLHNWIRLYALERAGLIDYKGYRSQSGANLLQPVYEWAGKWKGSSMFVGTSPEFELALYTICFLTKPNTKCVFKINNQRVKVQTYRVSYSQKKLATAYPLV